ncbi:Gfo/Idh/MocA family oxidoreductase [Patescibacteria group bacterium]|nr:Gfo/Idh/MocA family oxidoreductase [Patescibacteria group bacterium]MCL5798039.1 Gfo/Idh/MocA family oxidoreductase [Patescibacteria group bacterium]
MKFLFCGLGSIGQQHLNNLLKMGEKDIIAYRTTTQPLRFVRQEIKTFSDFGDAIKQKPDVAFITNPSSLHIDLANKLAQADCHLFIEKPLSDSTEGVKKLQEIVRQKELIVQIGFMHRYHPAFIRIKKILKNKIIGNPVYSRVIWGEFLPNWHPWENYKKSYAANKELGGGPINTLCHDLDILYWYFGLPTCVIALNGKKSLTGVNTEDNVEILMKYSSNTLAEIHLDYILDPPKRYWEIVGDKGRIELDFFANKLYIFNKNKKEDQPRKQVIDYSKGFNRNNMFYDEVKEFIDKVKNKKHPSISLEDGIANLRLLLATHDSIKYKRIIDMDSVIV